MLERTGLPEDSTMKEVSEDKATTAQPKLIKLARLETVPTIVLVSGDVIGPRDGDHTRSHNASTRSPPGSATRPGSSNSVPRYTET